MEKRTITIDNGGSELRYISNTDGRAITAIDKHISILDREDFRVKDSVGKLDIIDITKAPKKEYCNMYATGVGHYMYSGIDIAMTSQNRKSESVAWYQQLLIAIARDAITAKLVSDVPIEGSEDQYSMAESYNYIVTTLIPVNEHSGSKDYVSKVKENLQGDYEVYFPAMQGVNSVKFTIEKKNIGVLPEGVVVLSALMDKLGSNDYTLIIDMGHVTTDLVICKGINMLGSSVMSSSFAGGTILKLVSSIFNQHGVVCSDETAVEALSTNTIRVGKNVIDISKEIQNIKRTFVTNYMKKEILTQIELSGISALNIQNIVPIGAVLGIKNASTGEYDILQMIIEECGLANADVKILNEDLRYVNVSKAADFCDAFANKV